MIDVEDSVPVDDEEQAKPVTAISFKPLMLLFLLFLLVTSDVFIANVVGKVGGTGTMWQPTVFGAIIQGIFLIIFYAVALYMMEHDMV
jgi:phosphoglycerol transferase MdoB-like AlkP superfamily enzyme